MTPVIRLRLGRQYLLALQYIFIFSTVLLPLSADWFSSSFLSQMPVQFSLSWSDFLKLFLLVGTLICFSVSLALILQYHWLSSTLQIAVDCSGPKSSNDKGAQTDPVIPLPSPLSSVVNPHGSPVGEDEEDDGVDKLGLQDTPTSPHRPPRPKTLFLTTLM